MEITVALCCDVVYLTFSHPTSWTNLDWVLLIFDIRSPKQQGLSGKREISLLKTELSWLFSEWHYICLPQPAARNFNTGLLAHLRSSIASCILFINSSRKYNSIEIIYPLCQHNNATYLVIQKIRIGNVFQYLLFRYFHECYIPTSFVQLKLGEK